MKKNTIKSEYNGIRVTDSISFTVPKRHDGLNILLVILIAFCGLIGTVFSFTTMFRIAESEWKSVLFYTLFSFLAFTVIFLLRGKLKAVIIPVLLIFSYLLYKKWDDYVYGFMIVVNKMQSVVKPSKGPIFKITKELISKSDAIMLFIGFTVFIIAFIICFSTVFRPNFFLGFFITFPVIETGLYFGKAPKYIFAFLVFAYWAGLLVLHHSGYRQSVKRKPAGFFRIGNVFTAKPGVRFSAAGVSGLIMLSLSIFIMSMSSLLLDKIDFQRSEKINTMRLDIKQAASEFSFDDLGSSIQRISAAAGIGNFSYHNRKLGNMKKITLGNRTDLIVESKDSINNNIYLKGYVGSVYDGDSWDVLGDSDYKEYDDFYSLCRETGDFPQDMLVKSIGLKDFANGETTEMSVASNKRIEGSNYIPYNSVPMGKITYINDTTVKLESKKKYKFDISQNQDFTNIFYEWSDNKLLSDYEQKYTEFVNDKYLEVPDNEEMREVKNIVDESEYAHMLSVGEKLAYIKTILANNAEYTLEPGKTPRDRDFVNYFLTENHKGYCVHFATSGVILARMAGIPARYTEGYVVTADDFNDKNKQSDGHYKIEIKDSRAHAWAEIYIPGYGWIPYEFTPASAAALTSYSQEEETSEATNETKASETAVSRPSESRANRITSERKTTVSSAVTSSVGKVKKSVAYKSDETDYKIYITLIIAVLMLLIIIYAFVKRKYVISKRYKKIHNKDLSKSSVYIYNYIIDLLTFCGHEISNLQYMDFANYIENNTDLFKSGEFKRLTQIFLKAALSHENIDIKEINFMLFSADKLAAKVYKRASLFGKFTIKFIKNLY